MIVDRTTEFESLYGQNTQVKTSFNWSLVGVGGLGLPWVCLTSHPLDGRRGRVERGQPGSPRRLFRYIRLFLGRGGCFFLLHLDSLLANLLNLFRWSDGSLLLGENNPITYFYYKLVM